MKDEAKRKADREELRAFCDSGLDISGRTMLMFNEVDEDMLVKCQIFFHLTKDGPVTIMLNSPGGDVWTGMAIVDLIKLHPYPVTIIVNGMAASMACVLLQAATHRIATRNAVLMHHVGSMGVEEGHFKNVKKLMEFNEKFSSRADQMMLDRVNEKRRKNFEAGDKECEKPRTMAWWKEYDTFDRWMTTEQAIEIGLLDSIL